MMMENGMYYADGYNGDQQAYMEQEEEWEREGLLDPAWEKQQKKVSGSSDREGVGKVTRDRIRTLQDQCEWDRPQFWDRK